MKWGNDFPAQQVPRIRVILSANLLLWVLGGKNKGKAGLSRIGKSANLVSPWTVASISAP
jgi:hypothetical protein